MAGEIVGSLVESLGGGGADELYACPAAALSIHRFGAPLAQEICLRLLFVPERLSLASLKAWLRPGYERSGEEALTWLRRLRILAEEDGLVSLHPAFKRSLRRAHLGQGSLVELEPATFVEPKSARSVEELGEYGRKRWEWILEYLALPSTASSKEVSAETKAMLLDAGLSKGGGDNPDAAEITSAGFQFLLMERHLQAWTYLKAYLSAVRRGSEDGALRAAQSLAFLCRLFFASPSEPLSTEGWDWANGFLQHLRQLGFVFQRRRKDGLFYATPSLAALAGREGLTEAEASDGGRFLVVESNYRIYAYTSSTLHLAILSTFADLTYRFQGTAVAILSRESVRRALGVGIAASHILAYLNAHANTSVLRAAKEQFAETGSGGGLGGAASSSSSALLPPSIADQIRLWEAERERFSFTPVSLYSNFDSDQDYQKLAAYAKAQGCLEWHSPEKRLLVLNGTAHDAVKAFWKQGKGKD